MGFLWRSAIGGMAAVAVSCVAGLVSYFILTIPCCKEACWHREASGCTASRRRQYSHRRKARRGMPGVLGYSATALGTYGLLALMLSSDTLVAKHYLSNYQAGLYAGVSLAGKIGYFAASSLFVISFPVFSRYHDQGLAGSNGCSLPRESSAVQPGLSLQSSPSSQTG